MYCLLLKVVLSCMPELSGTCLDENGSRPRDQNSEMPSSKNPSPCPSSGDPRSPGSVPEQGRSQTGGRGQRG